MSACKKKMSEKEKKKIGYYSHTHRDSVYFFVLISPRGVILGEFSNSVPVGSVMIG